MYLKCVLMHFILARANMDSCHVLHLFILFISVLDTQR